MKRYFALILTLILFLPRVTLSQSQTRDSTTNLIDMEVKEHYQKLNGSDNMPDPEIYYQYLQDLNINPVNINQADMERLMQIPGINHRLANSIILYRTHIKPFESVDEITRVKGIGKMTLQKIRPFITIGFGNRLRRQLYGDPHYWVRGGKIVYLSRIQTVIQKPTGYQNIPGHTHYSGNRYSYYQRLTYETPHFGWNITQQKDPGETMDGNLGFDYTSISLELQNNGDLKDLVIGDYDLSFGQGLLLGSGWGSGKGSNVTNGPFQNHEGVKSYRSSSENNFMRGLAFTYGRKLQATFFYSKRRYSASVIHGDTVKKPSSTGLYRTPTEISRRYDIGSRLLGGHITYQHKNFISGITIYDNHFDHIVERGSAFYQKYDFQGSELGGISSDFTWSFMNGTLYGEFARSNNGGLAGITGLQVEIDANTDMLLIYRNYGASFWSLFGSAFGEQSGPPQNEKGFYIGIKHNFRRSITAGTYFDQYHFPFARYRTNEASNGYDWLGYLNYQKNSGLLFSLLGRYEQKQQNIKLQDALGRQFEGLGWHKRASIRFQIDFLNSKNIRSRSRVEWTRTRLSGNQPEFGFLLSQDISWQINPKIRFQGRVMEFDTDSYDARLYEYENGLLYMMSTPAFSGKGERYYVVMKYEPFSIMSIYAKYDITIFENKQSVGSGLDQISGNKRSHIGIEMRIRF